MTNILVHVWLSVYIVLIKEGIKKKLLRSVPEILPGFDQKERRLGFRFRTRANILIKIN